MSTPTIPPIPPVDANSEPQTPRPTSSGAVPPPIPADETVVVPPITLPGVPENTAADETIAVGVNKEPGNSASTTHGAVPPPIPAGSETVVINPGDAPVIPEAVLVEETYIPPTPPDNMAPAVENTDTTTPAVAPVMPVKPAHTEGLSIKSASLISNIVALLCVAGCLAAALWAGWLLYDNFSSFREPSELAKNKNGETLVVGGPLSAPDAVSIETVLDNSGDTDGYIVRIGSSYMPVKRPSALIEGRDNDYTQEIEPLYDSEVGISYNGNKGYLTYDGKRIPLTFVKQ